LGQSRDRQELKYDTLFPSEIEAGFVGSALRKVSFSGFFTGFRKP